VLTENFLFGSFLLLIRIRTNQSDPDPAKMFDSFWILIWLRIHNNGSRVGWDTRIDIKIITVKNTLRKSTSSSAAKASCERRRLFVMMSWGGALVDGGGWVVQTTVLAGRLRFLSAVIFIVWLKWKNYVQTRVADTHPIYVHLDPDPGFRTT